MKFASWPADKIKEKTDKKFSDLIDWSTLWIDDGIVNVSFIERKDGKASFIIPTDELEPYEDKLRHGSVEKLVEYLEECVKNNARPFCDRIISFGYSSLYPHNGE